MAPLLIGSIGISINLLVGETDRKKRRGDDAKPTSAHDAAFAASLILVISALVIGAFLNQNFVVSFLVREFPLVLLGALLAVASAYTVPKLYNGIGFIRKHHSDNDNATKEGENQHQPDEDPLIV